MQTGNYYFDTAFLIIAALFVISFLIQLYYYIFIYGNIIRKPKNKTSHKIVPVSVIICAQNEEYNLDRFLPSVLNQDYPDYEVIVVDDCSTDHTAEVLSAYKKKYPHLKVTFINKDDKFTHGKKLALTVGIKAATNEWLLLTDADCQPVSKNWIKAIAANFSDDKSVVLGYSGFFPRKSILNNIIRFDNLFIAIQYLGFALKGKPYMGVGRNLAYRKSLFFENKGFSRHYKILSGDDDIFVNEVATKNNTCVEMAPDSIVLSVPQKYLSSWCKQKSRHFQAGKYYSKKSKSRLAVEVFSRLVFYMTFITLFYIIDYNFIWYLSGVFLFRLIIQLTVFKYAIIRLQQKNLLLPSLIYDIVLPFFNFFCFASNFFTKDRNTWK
ncbi:MAG: glycosyltransferase [Bacteroidales bacterium]|nr:glycosyltransferase [Bacteroidales bacterium]